MAAGDDSSVPLGTPTGSADTRLNAAGEHRQVMVVGNAFDAVANMDVPSGSLMVNTGPNTLFIDGWAGAALDTTDRWTVAAGASPGVASGVMTMPATVSTYNAIQSKGSMPYTLGYQYVAMGITLEATAAVGAGRFWGFGTFTGSPTATRLVTDGIGFEIDQATGSLLAVTYSGGTRTTVATLTRPGDNAIHRYALYFRPTMAQWFVDNLQVAVASQSFPAVPVQELPVLIVRQNAASFTGTPVFTNIAAAVGDTSRMGQQIQDGAFPWRKAKVDTFGNLNVAQSDAAVHTIGTATGTTPATTGQLGRLVRATANVAQATAATLIAAPAAGTRIYVTNILANNEGATLTTVRLFAGSLPAAAGAVAVTNDVIDLTLAASGGGAVVNLPTHAPWALPVATALSFAVTAATTWDVSVTYYVAA